MLRFCAEFTQLDKPALRINKALFDGLDYLNWATDELSAIWLVGRSVFWIFLGVFDTHFAGCLLYADWARGEYVARVITRPTKMRIDPEKYFWLEKNLVSFGIWIFEYLTNFCWFLVLVKFLLLPSHAIITYQSSVCHTCAIGCIAKLRSPGGDVTQPVIVSELAAPANLGINDEWGAT